MVKKIFSVLALACVAMAAQAQYQLANSGFENWETVTYTYGSTSRSGEEPTYWSSFLDGTGDKAYYAAYSQLAKETTEKHSGNYSAKLTSRAVKVGFITLAVAQGNLTTGCVNMGSTDATDASGNYNYINEDRTDQSMKFTGHPDAAHIWVKFSGTKTGNVEIILTTKGYYQSPDGNEDKITATKVAKAQNNTIASDANTWQELTIPFTYSTSDNPYYALVNISTCATAGAGNANDYMYVDDLEMLYYSELSTATYDGSSVSFTDGSANVNALYDESKLALTSDGHAATIEKSYDATTGTLTVTVKGENISEDATNYHTYTIHFLTKASMAVTSAKYGTFCAPFDVTIPSGVKAYTVEGVSSDYVLNLSEVTGTIPAGTAVVLSSDNVVSSDVTGFNNSSAKSCTTGLLTGVYTAITVPAFDASRNNNYILQSQNGKVGFYQIDEDGHAVAANRCYLSLPESASPAKVYYFNVIDGISSVEADKAENNVTYDLAGRRVNNATKGVYIINGKKVLK